VESSVAAEDMWRAAAANRSPLDMQCVGIITVREHRTLLANAVDSRTLLPTSIDRRRAVGDECFVYCTDSNKARRAPAPGPPSAVRCGNLVVPSLPAGAGGDSSGDPHPHRPTLC
jgi:hypothetical protein